MLEVSVKRHDQFTSAVIKPGHQRSSLTVVFSQMHNRDSMVRPVQRIQDARRIIRASVIYQNKFPRVADLIELRPSPARKVREA